jgi:predicted nucleic acid-binding protein
LERPVFVIDSSVIIDYKQTDIEILRLVSNHLGRILVSPATLAEIKDFDRHDCTLLGLEIINPALDEYIQAASHKEPGLSAEDYLCLILAKRLSAICLCNDRAMHKACRGHRVQCMWGLRPMLELVQMRTIPPKTAWRIAQQIYSNNVYITETVIVDFRNKLDAIVSTKLREKERRSRSKDG